jgi:hypothetical protein
MKIFSIGYDNRTGKKLLMPSWHKTEFDFMSFNGAQESEWNRFWFTTDETVVEIDIQNKTARIKERPFTVKTEKMVMVNGTLKTSLIQDLNSPAGKWCDFFDQNINNYYAQFPVFGELERIARITAVLQGLRDCGIIFQDIKLPNTITKGTPTASKTAIISALKTRTVIEQTGNLISTSKESINIIGGVGLQQVKTAYKSKLVSDYSAGKRNVERIF